MSQVHEMLAILQSEQKNWSRSLVNTRSLLNQKNVNAFMGTKQTFVSVDSDKDDIVLSDTVPQYNAKVLIGNMLKAATNLIDVFSSIDKTNCNGSKACADVIVGEKVLIKEVSVITILKMIDIVEEIFKFIDQVPVLDTSRIFTYDPNGQFHTIESEKLKYEMISYHRVVHEYKDGKHPVEIRQEEEKVLDGRTQKIERCSLITMKEKRDMLAKIKSILDALKQAKARANQAETLHTKFGDELLGDLLV